MGENITIASVVPSNGRTPHTITAVDGRTFKMFATGYGSTVPRYLPKPGEVCNVTIKQSSRNGISELQITDISLVSASGHDPFEDDVAAGEQIARAKSAGGGVNQNVTVALQVLTLATEHRVPPILLLDTYYALVQDLSQEAANVSLTDLSADLMKALGVHEAPETAPAAKGDEAGAD